MHPGLDMTAPSDAAMYYVRMEGHYAVGSDTSVTVAGKLRRGRTLAVRPTLGGDRRRHALGSARGIGIEIHRAGRWKSSAFMVYVRAGGESAESVPRALSKGI